MRRCCSPRKTCADMQLLPRACFCFLALSGLTFGDQSGRSATRVTVKEDDDVVLPCSFNSSVNIESLLFDWKKDGTVPQKEVFMYNEGKHYNNGLTGQDEQFKGRISHFPGELKQGNASIRINKVRLEDKGIYTCIFPRMNEEFDIELVVEGILKDRTGEKIHEGILKDRTGEKRGVSPKPIVTILDDKGSLQCEVYGASPEPKIEWRDSDNQTLHSENPHITPEGSIILKTTVTKTGFYHCVSTQKEIWHQISSKTFVQLKDVKSGNVVIRATAVSVFGVIGIFVAV